MTGRHGFDFDQVFDDDYLYFYETILSEERTAADVGVIAALLDLRPGMRILDLACGHGRIANRLAERGASVVGLDASERFLELARKDAADRGVAVTYVHGDMRSLPWVEEFDAVISWFTALGYFSDGENRAVLREVHRALVPGGRFLIDHLNRDRILSNLQPAVVAERDGDLMIDRHTYFPDDGVIQNERIVVRDGNQRRFRFSVRMFTLPEIRDWLREAGFEDARGFDENGDAYSLDGRRMVVLATK